MMTVVAVRNNAPHLIGSFPSPTTSRLPEGLAQGDGNVTAATRSGAGTPTIAGITIRDVSIEAPWDWLNAGWRDMWVHPHVSLLYGVLSFVVAIALLVGISFAGMQSLILALAGGFLLIGPAIAVALYEISRRIETGERVTVLATLLVGAKAPGQLGFLGAVLAFFYFVWLETALLLFMLFMGGNVTFPPASKFVSMLLYEPNGLGLLVVGTFVGAVLAASVFSMSVVSVPLLMTQRIDTISAIYISVESVRLNIRPMALWAALVAATTGVGLVTCFVGLIVTFPLLGHASWHAFRDVIQTD